MVAEHHITPSDVILPIFVHDGADTQDIPSLPGVARLSIKAAVAEAISAADMGIPAIAVFPVTPPDLKSPAGSEATNPDNLICRAVAQIKAAVPHIGIITDVALDPYTTHGHDGIIDDKGYVLNDETLEVLTAQAVVQAKAGADIIAPSDMMDGRVMMIRNALDEGGFEDVSIMSYTAKYASAFYGPFRDAVDSKGALKGDKKTYQMDPRNRGEAQLEMSLDVSEGADMVMVKPGLPYLDIIRDSVDRVNVPVMAYHVSGEYAQLKAAAENGWLDYDRCILEVMTSFKRAGTRAVLTYAAKDICALL